MQFQAIDEGVKTTFTCINKDLVALDDHIDRRWDECKKALEELQAAKGRIEVLKEWSCTQCEMIEMLMAHVENIEGMLCHCGKGKVSGLT